MSPAAPIVGGLGNEGYDSRFVLPIPMRAARRPTVPVTDGAATPVRIAQEQASYLLNILPSVE